MKVYVPLILGAILGCNAPKKPQALRPQSAVVEVEFTDVRFQSQPLPPPFPLAAKLQKIVGPVEVQITIDSAGIPVLVQAVSGPAELRRAAQEYSMGLRFVPVLLHGTPQYARFKMTIPYALP